MAAEGQSGKGDAVYEVGFASPLPVFDMPGGKAYMASDADNPGLALYGLVQEPGVPGRAEVMKSLLQASIPNLVNPVDCEEMPVKDGSIRRVTFFERPAGEVLMSPRGGKATLTELSIRKLLIPTAINVLSTLHERGITHRAIRPDNIFFTDREGSAIVLGDCVTTPAGAGQLAVFEPLERATADQYGRGEADEKADIYALGVTILACFLKKWPGHGLNPGQVLVDRIHHGSFRALCGNHTIQGSMGVMLKGLLNDNPDERWDLTDLMQWVDGIVPQKRAGMKNWSLSSPVNFGGKTYADRRHLAEAFAGNVALAAAYIREQNFLEWSQRVLGNEVLSDRMERIINVQPMEELAPNLKADARLIAKLCLYLDPVGPVRYRNIAVCFDGLGPAIAHVIHHNDRDKTEMFSELLGSALISTLAEMAREKKTIVKSLSYEVGRAAELAGKNKPGHGLERALYELNPSLPCLSPHCQRVWACSARDALLALDQHASGQGELSSIFDLHMTAFCASKMQGIGRKFMVLARPNMGGGKYALALMEITAQLQRKLSIPRLPNLSTRFANALKPMIKALKNRVRRETLAAKLMRLSGQGNLNRMIRELDLANQERLDAKEFATARQRYREIENERRWLLRRISAREESSLRYGYQGSMLLGFIILAGTILNYTVGF